jgi:hypothetical protein
METRIQSAVLPVAQPVQILDSGQDWSLITFMKEADGSVVLSTREATAQVGTGYGLMLPDDQPFTILTAPGTKYWACTNQIAQSVTVIIQPLPQLALVPALLQKLLSFMNSKLGA